MISILGSELVALNNNNNNSVDFDGALLKVNSAAAPSLVDFGADFASTALSSHEPKWNPMELAAPFAEGRWNPMAPSGVGDVIDRITQFTPFKRGPRPAERIESFVCRDNPDLARVEQTSKCLPLKSLNLVISSEKKDKKESLVANCADDVFSIVFPELLTADNTQCENVVRKSAITATADAIVATEKACSQIADVQEDEEDFWGTVDDQVNGETEKCPIFVIPPVEVDCLPKALIMSFADGLSKYDDVVEDHFLDDLTANNDAIMCNVNNNNGVVPALFNEAILWNNNNNNNRSVMMMNNNNNNNNNNGDSDPTARFRSMSTMRVGPNNMYQPSAISASVERQGPFERYQYQTANKCRVGGQGPPGVPAAGGGHSSKPATREGVPWGTRKERKRQKNYINIEPYQTLKPSGHWMHGTKQRQPANKQAQATRAVAYPFYLPDNQKCKSRPEYRSGKAATGIDGSCKEVKLKKEKNIDLDKVRCNCPGLYPENSSHGPGNFWDEEDDDEAILAGMCLDDIEEECGQGQDGVFPLEEWSDEWEDGVTSGDCLRGKLAPGTLDLYPWENPCLEELQKRKRRIQELRNKRWAAISKAKDEAIRVKQDGSATQQQKKEADRQAEKVFNQYSQKSWSLLGWFNPANWASSGGSGCGEADTKREGKTTTVRSNCGAPTEIRGSTPAIKLSLRDAASCPSNSSSHNGSSNNTCRNNSSSNYANSNDNNCSFNGEANKCAPKNRGKGKRLAIEDYEWESADDSVQDYEEELAASGLKSRNDAKERIVRMQVEQMRRKKLKKEQEASRLREAANGAGILANIWGYFTGAHAKLEEARVDANVNGNNTSANIASIIEDANVNNNAANRCARPCPPCPQGDCEPPPFECPCNDVSCPKKLKPKNDNLDVNVIQSGGTTANIKRGDNNAIVDIEIDLKKPRPDLALGCPCGDEACKKKFCNKPDPPRKFAVCQLSKGPMNKQIACPEPDEGDICDKGDEMPKTCPCADEFCPNKPGGDGYFKYLYPPNDKMKFNEEGCPNEQQIECWVLPNGQVKMKPILSPLHCELIPPCPCDDWTKKEFDSCDCSGNSWGEEADDETLDEGECGAPPAEDDNDCGHQQIPGGLGKVDEYEWDQEDVPCIDIPDDASEDTVQAAEARKQCQEYMEFRDKKTGIMQAAMEAAIEAWKQDRARKEKEKGNEGMKKKKIEAYKAEGLDDEEIYDLMCVVGEVNPCDIVGDYPTQMACQPAPNDPPGCPCPDLNCPKRAPFDHTMFDKDMSKYKTRKEIAAAERYYNGSQYKTMECELKDPTYKDVGKGYPKAKQCPCPDCKEDDQKAWAEVEKMKIGPPPECPCQDVRCPKKPPRSEEEEIQMENSPCHMRGRYPKQSGCLDVIRCDLIKDPCNDPCVRPEDKKPPPKEEFRCHACTLKKPMPKQSSCPDYDCNECALVCDDCGCRPRKCDKCESEKPEVVPEQNLCAPCTVPRPFPKQSSCKELHPCDQEHPCMCDPSTGEAIDAVRCGPCDRRNHATYPEQSGCPKEEPPEADECELEAIKVKGKNLKAMKLFDTRTGFNLLENQATITCETDDAGNCKQGECNQGFSELTINLTDATKARLMPGNPASEGIIEGRGGKFIADPKKKQELDEKKKAITEAQVKCVRVIDYEASSNDAGIIDTDDKVKHEKVKQEKKGVTKALKNFKKSMSALKLADELEKAGDSTRAVAKKGKDNNNNADSSVNEGDEQGLTNSSDGDHVETSEAARLAKTELGIVNESAEEVEAQVPSSPENETKAEIPAFGEIQPEIVEGVEEAREVADFREKCCRNSGKKELEPVAPSVASREGEAPPSLDDERTNFQTNQNRFVEEKDAEENLEGRMEEGWSGVHSTPVSRAEPRMPMFSPSQQEAEMNCLQSCLFTGLDSPNIILKKSRELSVSDLLPTEMRPKMKCKQRRSMDAKEILGNGTCSAIDKRSTIDKPPTIDLSDDEGDFGAKFVRSTTPTFFKNTGCKDELSGLNSLTTTGSFPSKEPVSSIPSFRRSSGGIFHRSSTLNVMSSRLGNSIPSGKKSPPQELFLVQMDENGAQILGSVDYEDVTSSAKHQISRQFSQSATCALENGAIDEGVHYLSRAVMTHPEPKGFLDRLGMRNFLPNGFWSK